MSRDDGESWADWQDGLVLEEGIAAVAAPLGIETGAPLLVGCMAEGAGVLRI